jgi:hypothetical protein
MSTNWIEQLKQEYLQYRKNNGNRVEDNMEGLSTASEDVTKD